MQSPWPYSNDTVYNDLYDLTCQSANPREAANQFMTQAAIDPKLLNLLNSRKELKSILFMIIRE